MVEPHRWSAYDDVNTFLAHLLELLQKVLGAHLTGVYLSGSLALGDFDPQWSDIDLVAVTADVLPNALVDALRTMHAELDAGGSYWVGRVEVVYVPRPLLRHFPSPVHVPQVEKERGLFLDRLEDGWLSQCYIVREHGVTLLGPDPRTLFAAVDPGMMRCTVARIPELWLHEAHNDPTWVEWLRVRHNQAFVVLTLCRLLYTLETGAVASKPGAARWAQSVLAPRWTGTVMRALAGQHEEGVITDNEVAETIALVEHTVQCFRRKV